MQSLFHQCNFFGFFWLFLANAIFFQNQKSHQARTLCNYFEIQTQHQWKNFAHFIENNKIKIANKIKAKYKKRLLYLKRHFKMLHHMYNQNKILNLSLEFFNSSRFLGKYFYLWNEELNFHHGDPLRLLYYNTVHAVLDPTVTDILINPCSSESLIQILIQMICGTKVQ